MTEDLISQYRDAAKAHGEGTRTGDYRATNRAYDILTKILKKLSDAGTDSELLSLFDDEDISVQVWSAAHCLEICEQKARAKLQSIADASIPGMSMDAEYTLKGWDEGTLKFRS